MPRSSALIDGVLYTGSAVWAGAFDQHASVALHREWGQMPVGSYLAAAVVSLALIGRRSSIWVRFPGVSKVQAVGLRRNGSLPLLGTMQPIAARRSAPQRRKAQLRTRRRRFRKALTGRSGAARTPYEPVVPQPPRCRRPPRGPLADGGRHGAPWWPQSSSSLPVWGGKRRPK